MAKRTPRKAVAAKQAAQGKTGNEAQELSHRLNSLLHTVRCIAQHEDELCTLLHAAQQGPLTPELRAELTVILKKMPESEYEADLLAVEQSLGS